MSAYYFRMVHAVAACPAAYMLWQWKLLPVCISLRQGDGQTFLHYGESAALVENRGENVDWMDSQYKNQQKLDTWKIFAKLKLPSILTLIVD